MCGIVGLLVKKREQRASLGQLAQPMFTCMGERGPDSGGLASLRQGEVAGLHGNALRSLESNERRRPTDPDGIRTRVASVKGLCPGPLDDGALR